MANTYDCGHGCKITCPAGGGCIYSHDTGRCTTFCKKQGTLQIAEKSQLITVKPEDQITIYFEDVSIADVARLFRDLGLA